MQAIIETKLLKKEVLIATTIVKANQELPLISPIKMETTENGIQITGTDLDTFYVSDIEAETVKDGECYIDGLMLKKILAVCDNEIEIKVSGRQIHITSGKSSWSLNGLETEDFPLPLKSSHTETTLGLKSLKNITTKSFAIGKDRSRRWLTQIRLYFDKKKVTAVATDGHRLTYLQSNGVNDSQKVEIGISLDALKLIKKLPVSDDDVYISTKGERVRLAIGNRVIDCRTSSNFPDYNRILPKDNSETVKFDIARMGQILTQMLVDNNNILIWTLKTDGVSSLENHDRSTGFSSSLVALPTQAMKIKLNPNYILDFCKLFKSGVAEMTFKNANSVVMFRPLKAEPNEQFDYIMMPLREAD